MTQDRTIAVDSCALADLFVGEASFSQSAESLRRQFPIWKGCSLIRIEFGNVLRTMIRAGKIKEHDAKRMFIAGLEMVGILPEPLPVDIFDEATLSNLTFYDAMHVRSAKDAGLMLYTRDKEVLKNCASVAKPIL